MLRRLGAFALAISTVTVPVASAATPSCDQATVDAVEVDGTYVHVTDDAAEIWEESNGVDGLQTQECLENGRLTSPDTFDREAPPEPPSLPSLPDPGSICISPLPGSMICLL